MPRLEICDFDGDLKALEALAQGPWREEYGIDTWPDLYKPAFTAQIFGAIPDPRLLVGAYDGSKLVAFVANLPRIYRVNGVEYRAAIPALLVAHPEYRGAILPMMGECLRRNRDFEADFVIMTQEAGHHGQLMMDALRGRMRIKTLFSTNIVVRTIDFHHIVTTENLNQLQITGLKLLQEHHPIHKPDIPGEIRSYRESDTAQIMALTRQVSDRSTLVRVFIESGLMNFLHAPGATETLVYEIDGQVRGFLTYSIREMVKKDTRFNWAWMELLYWEGLENRVKRALLAEMWGRAQAAGCKAILEWDKKAYTKMPLYQSCFIPQPRPLQFNAWILNEKTTLPKITRFYERVI